jgi:hypothetical protein
MVSNKNAINKNGKAFVAFFESVMLENSSGVKYFFFGKIY